MCNEFRNKYVTAEQAVKAVQSGDWVDYGFGGGYPELLDKALATRKGEVTDVKIRGGLVIRPRIEVVECDPEQTSFHYYSWHIGDYERKLQSSGLVQFMPMILRNLPDLYRHPGRRQDPASVHRRPAVSCHRSGRTDPGGGLPRHRCPRRAYFRRCHP